MILPHASFTSIYILYPYLTPSNDSFTSICILNPYLALPHASFTSFCILYPYLTLLHASFTSICILNQYLTLSHASFTSICILNPYLTLSKNYTCHEKPLVITDDLILKVFMIGREKTMTDEQPLMEECLNHIKEQAASSLNKVIYLINKEISQDKKAMEKN